jgi:hypothetical protein
LFLKKEYVLKNRPLRRWRRGRFFNTYFFFAAKAHFLARSDKRIVVAQNAVISAAQNSKKLLV